MIGPCRPAQSGARAKLCLERGSYGVKGTWSTPVVGGPGLGVEVVIEKPRQVESSQRSASTQISPESSKVNGAKSS